MRRTNIYLDDEQTAALDRIAKQEHLSRAEIIRRLLSRALEGRDDDLDADLEAIDASFGACRDVDAVGRGLDERAAHLDRMWQA